MTYISQLSRLNIAGLIGQTLTDHGIDAVLTGGSCLAIYSSERWVSQDLDLIDISFSDKSKIVKALSTIGFLNKGPGHRYYEHPECKFPIEFPTGPLAIGEEPPISSEGITEITTPHGTFKILSTTNCVKDRLINYLLYNDMQCLDQARYVAQNKPVDMNNITNWLRNEGSDLDPRELLLETKLTSFPPSLDR